MFGGRERSGQFALISRGERDEYENDSLLLLLFLMMVMVEEETRVCSNSEAMDAMISLVLVLLFEFELDVWFESSS